MNEKLTTFWEYLCDYYIKIPIIQRDYAQGRKGKSALRRRFLTSIHNALAKEEPLKLDFVYGTVRANVSLPLDGQQRLTTLWLLHWFAAYKAKKLVEVKTILKKFSYETRISSRIFCELLCDFDGEPESGKTIAESIQNQTWFHSAWEQDPTIAAMLCMISGEKDQPDDCLEKVFRDFAPDTLWKRLTEKLVYFYAMDIGEMLLTDDLYIKMNARGEPLSPCENFKADLFEYVRESAGNHENQEAACDLSSPEIMKKWDNSWTDIFWQKRCLSNCEKWNNRIDEIFLAFINRFWLNYMIEKDLPEAEVEQVPFYPTTKNGAPCYENELEYHSMDDYISVSFRSKEENEKKEFDLKEAVQSLERILDNYYNSIISKNLTFPIIALWDEKTSAKDVFIPRYKTDLNENDKYPLVPISQRDRVIFYAVCKFLDSPEPDFEKLKDWMRVVWNIVGNSTIDTIAAMTGAIKLIAELAEHRNDIIAFLAGDSNIKSEFATDQMKEERLKAKMIRNAPNAKDIIIEIEKDQHFKGRIISLLYAKKESDTQEFASVSAQTLQNRYRKFCEFFTYQTASDLGRELLHYGDYTNREYHRRFITSDKSLYEILHSRDTGFYSYFLPVFIEFLDSTENPERTKNPFDMKDWKYYFTKYKVILDGNENENGLFAWDNDFCCRRLQGTNKKGKHCCPYILAALNACEEDICNVKNVEKWSSSRNALQGYTSFADCGEIKLQQAAETGKVTLSVRYVSDNNRQTCNVDWEQDCDLIDFLKDKIREIISPQAAASQTPLPAADFSPCSGADILPLQNGD